RQKFDDELVESSLAKSSSASQFPPSLSQCPVLLSQWFPCPLLLSYWFPVSPNPSQCPVLLSQWFPVCSRFIKRRKFDDELGESSLAKSSSASQSLPVPCAALPVVSSPSQFPPSALCCSPSPSQSLPVPPSVPQCPVLLSQWFPVSPNPSQFPPSALCCSPSGSQSLPDPSQYPVLLSQWFPVPPSPSQFVPGSSRGESLMMNWWRAAWPSPPVPPSPSQSFPVLSQCPVLLSHWSPVPSRSLPIPSQCPVLLSQWFPVPPSSLPVPRAALPVVPSSSQCLPVCCRFIKRRKFDDELVESSLAKSSSPSQFPPNAPQYPPIRCAALP
ncbi:hypothetical protein IHE44_0010876, partial [Lamprotornis superbus]